jgi:2-polyprenyl-3-methyl-5-hydroxy-6-metoxy-1,4-benzoquinol methylase
MDGLTGPTAEDGGNLPVEQQGGGDGFAAVPTLAEANARLTVGGEGWARLDACPICASAAIEPLATLRHMPYERCRECGFTFTNPQAPDAVRAEFYDSAFYTNYRRLEDLRRLEDPYFSVSMYTDSRRLGKAVADARPESVLDFGCGTGSFLAMLRDEFGLTAVDGLEISEEARQLAERAYGLKIAATPADLPRPHYDFALLLEVIEHVPDPHAIVAELVELVAPGGRILITTPAVDNLRARRLPGQCAHYTAPSHISLFTEDAMRRLLETHSLRVVDVDTDPETGMASACARSLLYSLDYLSPTAPDDYDDLLFRPTPLGRLLGRKPTRRPLSRGALSKLLPRADRLVERVLPRPDHLYVVAERV